MASCKSGFDPPTRPGDLPRGRRPEAYLQAGSSGSPAKERREADIAHSLGQRESGRGAVPSTRPSQTGLSNPSMRDPSPNTRQRHEKFARPERPKGVTTSSFGFGRSTSKAPAENVQHELTGKSSRNTLRRKPSSIAQISGNFRPGIERAGTSSPMKWSQSSAEKRPSIDSSMRSAEAYNEIFTRPRTRAPPVKDSPPIIPELDRYRNRPEAFGPHSRVHAGLPPKLSTQDLPPPTPILSGTSVYSGGSSHHRYSGYSGSGSGYSASPSTRFSESPGPGSYSRDTTPTSMLSQSSSIIAPLKITTPRLRHASPAFPRPPITSVTRRRAVSIPAEEETTSDDQHGLPSLRESLTSSSSNSTVKAEAKTTEKMKKKRLSPMPPSPPPRTSSQKFRKSRSDEQDSPSKSSQAPPTPAMTSTESSPATAEVVQSLSAPAKRCGPPTRPSREGAPDLQSQLGESMAVIQSNLAEISFSPDRRKSALPRGGITSPPLGPRSQQSNRHRSRNPSPVSFKSFPREATPAPSGLGIIPNMRAYHNVPLSRTVTRTPSPSLADTKPRFGLFGRRTKTAPELPTVETKVLRKGPVAGTGHEGYGRYSQRGRSTSTASLTRSRDRSISGASSSQDSIASTRAHDPFLLERMSPVIIAGGGEIIENQNNNSELFRSESNTSLVLGRPSTDSKASSNLSREGTRHTLWPSAMPEESAKRMLTIVKPQGRRPSDSSDDGIGRSSLAIRRSSQRPNKSNNSLNLTRPLHTFRGVSPSITSLDASIISKGSRLDVRAELEKTSKGVLTKPKKFEKRSRSPRKWNFFHRAQPTLKAESQPPLQVTVAQPAPKSAAVPHYAMLDSSDEQQDVEPIDLEDILRDADVVSLSNEELDMLQYGEIQEIRQSIESRKSATVSSADGKAVTLTCPEPIQVIPEILQTNLHLVEETAPVRPSRLPQVGRIPKVISARPETTSPKSFSRPFARLSTALPPFKQQFVDKESLGLGPSPPKSSKLEPIHTIYPEMEDMSRQCSTESKSGSAGASHHDFLAFSPRKNSEATTSSSGCLSLAEITAVIPETNAALEEDEVWDEYDDLIVNEDTVKVPTSATSSQGVPFQYESYESRRIRKSKFQAVESPTLTSGPKIKEQAIELPLRRSALTSSSVYSADMSAGLREALNTIPTPTSPMSFTDFFSGYGDRNNSANDVSAQKPRRSSNTSSRKSTSSSSHSHSNSSRMRTVSEQESSSPMSQVNLRVGSMTVSKWLTFGHVLFSPAREEIMQLEGFTKRHSILVIDGLGNDDWSFYAAETYPNSTFYNLSPTRPLSNSQRNSISASFPLAPPNHRQIQYVSTSHKFPFPSSQFDVIVFRFPTAMSEASYRNIIAESKRVLKPGGYLEMSILDLDMLNMGNRARRTVRSLKVKLQIASPDISLASASDTILRIVSKRGFSDVKSCNVGVPVVSTIPSATKDKSKHGKDSGSSKGKGREPRQVEELSLADMMKDESRAGDESITKMVAKVGRWWYTRCYEMGVIPEGDGARSIFNDRSLLRESEKWNASFKLVVAYAQKPVVGRRRTASL
ncbi:hypothetical protein WAI453_001249 [Rhynchosporium graminicola]